MQVAILFSSRTGNTERIASSIRTAVEESDELVYFGTIEQDIDADLYFIGSWTDKGTASAETLDYLSTLRDKKIAYFGTAGFGMSDDYFSAIASRALSSVDATNDIRGHFICQGRMPISVRERYERMLELDKSNARIKMGIDNFDRAMSHPDAEDIENAYKWALKVLNDAK